MHRLLARQLKKLQLDSSSPPRLDEWHRFLQQIDTSYEASDQDRYILERSLTLSSEEMQELYKRQKSTYESRMHAILHALPDTLFLLDEDGKYIEVMSGNETRLYRDKQALLGKTLHDVFPEKDAEYFLNIVGQAIASNRLVVVNYDMEVQSGPRSFEGRVMPANYTIDGKRTVVFLAIDVTDQRQSEIRGRLISAVFDNSKEGMVILDKDLKAVSVNESFCDITNHDRDAIQGQTPEFFTDLMSTDTGAQIWRSLEKSDYWMGEVVGRKTDGTTYPLWLTMNAVRDYCDKLTYYVAMLTDVSDIKRSQEELEYVATHDFLTNLPNRVLFLDRLQQALVRTLRSGDIGALFFLDLDRFKNVNDNLGHHVGDDLLKQVSERLRKVSRASDTLARLGGDEFTLVVEGLDDASQLAVIAEKILQAFAAPFTLDSYKLEISVSIGISVFPKDSSDINELIKHADTAMYSAKESGRNTYRFYTQELTTNAFEYFAMEIALQKAIERGEFFLVYQPQFNIMTNEMIGVEALLRWQHPDMGVLSPGVFVHIAEYCGKIKAIGEWVITRVCEQCNQWDAQGLPQFTVSLNLSRKQLVLPGLSEYVKKVLDDSGVPGERLEFEITESTILDRKDTAYENLKEMQQMGIRMAIDDFGTGYSSLVNLKQFPLSRLKIDRSFVRDVSRDPNDEAIIRATIALAKSFNLNIIAEGVEKEEQRDFLLKEGCNEAQGFLYSDPVSPEAIAEILLRRKSVCN
ncbi:MAG: EAL domain-containing protein [Thiotrichales bacterium]|nr:MAG: EAL domain-containing protein [Thiotrichales bacterium]